MFKLYLDGKSTAGGVVFLTREKAQAYIDLLKKTTEEKAKSNPMMKKALLDIKRIEIREFK